MDLNDFCHKGRGSTELSHPFSYGDYTYATNGHIAIRVPRHDDVPEVGAAPNMKKIFMPEVTGPPTAIDLNILPKATHKPCGPCASYGHGQICIECNGDGDHACDCHHCNQTCDHCDGAGIIRAHSTTNPADREFCNFCDGTGSHDDRRSASLDGRHLMVKYLDLIKKLPGPATVRLGQNSTDRHEFSGPGWTVILIGMACRGYPADITIEWPQTAEVL